MQVSLSRQRVPQYSENPPITREQAAELWYGTQGVNVLIEALVHEDGPAVEQFVTTLLASRDLSSATKTRVMRQGLGHAYAYGKFELGAICLKAVANAPRESLDEDDQHDLLVSRTAIPTLHVYAPLGPIGPDTAKRCEVTFDLVKSIVASEHLSNDGKVDILSALDATGHATAAASHTVGEAAIITGICEARAPRALKVLLLIMGHCDLDYSMRVLRHGQLQPLAQSWLNRMSDAIDIANIEPALLHNIQATGAHYLALENAVVGGSAEEMKHAYALLELLSPQEELGG